MPQYFGSKKRKPLPPNYNQNTSLLAWFEGEAIAAGKLSSDGFLLMHDSKIKKETTLTSNPGVIEIFDELKSKGFLASKDNDPDYFYLKDDILLPSANKAARLVHGNDRNARKDWLNIEGMPLGSLLALRINP